MRALAIASVLLCCACSTDRCKQGTLFVSYSLVGGAEAADSLDITLQVDQGAPQTKSVSRRSGDDSVEIDFASYPKGKSLTLTIAALAGGGLLASSSQTVTAMPGCTRLSFTLDGGANDLAMPSDMSPDLGSNPGSLSLLAGQLGGFGNADGTGAGARFSYPQGVALDGAGNLYVVDNGNSTIRKVVIATGQVTTLAGTPGVVGTTDGTGAAARFNQPTYLAADGAGNLYVTDFYNNTIRKVVIATGEVTTLAGQAGAAGSSDGIGAAARFNYPTGIASDGAGNLYVAEYGNSTIRKIVIASREVTTLAGQAGMNGSVDGTGTAARFSNPYGVALDGSGNLYVADTNNNTIRKLVIGTGAVVTLAGTAGVSGSTDGTGMAARFGRPQGIAVDGAGSLYVAEYGNSTIRKVVIATGVVTTLAGSAGVKGSDNGIGAAARFNSPTGLIADAAGNLFVGDSFNAAIRKIVTATADVSTLAGLAPSAGGDDGSGTAARFNAPFGMTADATGNLHVADANNHTIRKIVIATGEVTTLAGSAGMSGSADGMGAAARFNFPRSVTSDGAGNVFVADTSNHTIRKIAVATGAVMTLAGTAGMKGSADGIGTAARFNLPWGVAFDGSGNLYVADTMNSTIRKVVIATGEVTTLVGSPGVAGSSDGLGDLARFNEPEDVATNGADTLYVTDGANCTIRKVAIANREVSTLAGQAGNPGSTDGTGGAARFVRPGRVAVDGLGSIYVTDSASHTVRKIVLSTGAVTTPIGSAGHGVLSPGPLPASMSCPAGIVALSGSDLAITDFCENAVLVLRPRRADQRSSGGMGYLI